MKLHKETLDELRAAIGKRGGINELVKRTGFSRTWVSLAMNGHVDDQAVIDAAINYANELKRAELAMNKRTTKKIQRIINNN